MIDTGSASAALNKHERL